MTIMFGFFFKKNLCDVWDNLFYVVITNFFSLILIALACVAVYFETYLNVNRVWVKPLMLGTFTLFSILACTLTFAGGENAYGIAKYNSPKYASFFKGFIKSFKDGLSLGLFIGIVAAIAFVSIPFYFSMWKPEDGSTGSIVWLGFIILIFWFLVATFFALQWYMPIRISMKNGFFKCLKKSYLLLLDNLGFTFALALVNFLNLLITLFTFGLCPGLTGIIITNMNALRLRMYKYDWLEVNPGLSMQERKDVPWDELLAKDKKTLGPRPLKSFIFPWKE